MIIDIHGHYTTAPKALEAGATARSRASGTRREMPQGVRAAASATTSCASRSRPTSCG